MDASRGVSSVDYKLEKQFVKSMSYHFNISPSGPRATAVIYATNPQTIAEFTDSNFNQRIDNAVLLGTPRRLDRALDKAAEILSTSPATLKIVVLLTAGKETPDPLTLSNIAKKFRQLGTQNFLVTIGHQPDIEKEKLKSIVQKPQNIFEVNSYGNLPSMAKPLAKQIHERAGIFSEQFVCDEPLKSSANKPKVSQN